MDMQFNILANAPEFKGLGGVMEYLSSYTDEEYLRWAMRLYRHYAIEGNRNMLSEKYGYAYAPSRLVNPDFEKGLDGWDVQPAAPGSVSAGRYAGYSWLQGRYPRTEVGDTFLVTTRSDVKPNIISQPVRGLKPGALYSLKLYTGDYGDLKAGQSRRQKHAVSVRMEPSDPVESRSFQHVLAQCYSHDLGPFNREHRYWMNYHQRVFRAGQETAILTISDWAGEAEAGGPAGQQLMLNFVELQSYFDE